LQDQDKPFFLVTIDTEGDDLWSRPRTVTTRNTAYIPRFQELCEKYGFSPTYLADYDMVHSTEFQRLAKSLLRDRRAEIGMHAHAWRTPPLIPVTEDEIRFAPFMTEYSAEVIDQKVGVMTRLIEDVFATRPLSHRAGRWGFNEIYARSLVGHGYQVDCSVVPHVNYAWNPGAPQGRGGPDFRDCMSAAYYVDPDDFRRAGSSPLLEVPLTVIPVLPRLHRLLRALRVDGLFGSLLNRLSWGLRRFRPNGRNRRELLWIIERALLERREYVEFMLHSSELMPGGSPTFPSEESIESLYRDLELLFKAASTDFRGAMLSEFYESYKKRFRPGSGKVGMTEA
jgi:hypothetical protein